MTIDMNKWIKGQIEVKIKKSLPVLSFPAVQLLNVSVRELISDSSLQARGMKLVSDRAETAASVSLMDLSVEAEAFGSAIIVSDDEVPTVKGSIIANEEDADKLEIPLIGSGRTGIYIESVKKAVELITDRPVFAGAIGPFSLAGRLLDVSEALVYCYDEPDMVHKVMEKTTAFITDYCNGYKEAGANGIFLAEPLAGILSPALGDEFSSQYVKRIVESVQDDNFIIIYHNCGNNALLMIDSILSTGAAVLHFGNAISMAEMMTKIPSDIIAMGNIDPASVIRNGSPESVRAATIKLMEECCKYPNFVISSGCDIPPLSPWENIDAFFNAVREFC